VKSRNTIDLSPKQRAAFVSAIRTDERIRGLTHGFYRYPARFSPQFPAAAIRCFTKPGDLVLDPYMGGGTTVVEAMAAGRRVIGNDLNELAVFVARVKTSRLISEEVDALHRWALEIPGNVNFRRPISDDEAMPDVRVSRNLGLYRSRYVKKGIALALGTVSSLPTENCRNFARCAILHVSQLALDGRRTHTSLEEFRAKLRSRTIEMLDEADAFSGVTAHLSSGTGHCYLYEGDARELPLKPAFTDHCEQADLVITSPPYPGVHVLYHRWQVDGRKETPAPYWIAACRDGEGAAYYNFGGRKQLGLRRYFESAAKSFAAVRSVMKNGAYLVQLVAFSDPTAQLPLYLDALAGAGLEEAFLFRRSGEAGDRRVWRDVPNRKWHATSKGITRGAREVVLIHRAM